MRTTQRKFGLAMLAAMLAVGAFSSGVRAEDTPKAGDATGTWTWAMPGRGGRGGGGGGGGGGGAGGGGQQGQRGAARVMKLTLKQDGDKLTGTVNAFGNDTEIQDGTVKDGEISFKVTRKRGDNDITSTYTGKVEGDTIKGSVEAPGRDGNTQKRDWEAKRSTGDDKDKKDGEKPAEGAEKTGGDAAK